MHINLSTKLNLLTRNSKILVVGTLNERLKSIVEQYFEQKEYIDLTEKSVEIINSNFVSNYDVAIFILNKNSFEILKQIPVLQSDNIIYLINDDIYMKNLDHISTTLMQL